MNYGEDPDRLRTWEDVQHEEELALEQRTGHPSASPRVGLAFSGGGIRSATFNLGILQALAKQGVLPCIDYLSTVSGGGYIGGWLIAWIQRDGAQEVYRQLAAPADSRITWLRRFSNYLTPRAGLLSTDSLAFGLTYIRNVVLNLGILVSLLAGLMLVPRMLAQMAQPALPGWTSVLAPAADLLLAVAAAWTGWNLARIGKPDHPRRQSAAGVFLTVVLPLLLMASLWAFALWESRGKPHLHGWGWWVGWTVGGYEIACLLAVLCYYGFRPRHLHTAWIRRNWWLAAGVSGLVAGSFWGFLLWKLQALFSVWRKSPAQGVWLFVGWGAPLVAVSFLAAAGLHVGLMGNSFSDELREWLTRAAALACGTFIGLIAFFAITVYGPWLFTGPGPLLAMAGAIWLAAIVAGLLAGKKVGQSESGAALRFIAQIAPSIFLLGLCALLSRVVGWAAPPAAWLAPACAALIVLALLLSWRVDLNEFSMQMLYRNRLVRCYIGASHQPRNPQPLTGFDPDDDIPLSSFCPGESYSGPLPIFNTTLNEVCPDDLAWQERKGRSFTFTPLYSGYGDAAYRPTNQYGYSGGVFLGTAMGISGAAANPGLGPKTRPDLAALMTVFDIRLGWWMGNPVASTWKRSSPRLGLPYLLRELLGKTTEDSAYINLSDGGNFENLGIYELVRRRCRFIIACDADMDGELTCDDLANAIRKCRIDFRTEIDIDVTPIRARQRYWAQGTIAYPGDEPAGTLIYLKASVLAEGGKEPTDVLAYKTRCPAFPHESTADQWFSEDQFESYRCLGQHIAETAIQQGAVTALNQHMASAAAAPTPGHSGRGSAAAQSPTGPH